MDELLEVLAKLRTFWKVARIPDILFPDWSRWYGYGIGVEEQGAHIVLFCNTAKLPPALAFFSEQIGSQQYRLDISGRTIEVRIIVTGRFVSAGGGPVAVPSSTVRAGGRVRATWIQGTIHHPIRKESQFGTIGAILRLAGDPKPWMLSANHVIGINCGEGNRDLEVHFTDGASTGELIGKTVKCIPMSSAPCPADAAAVQIDLPTSRIDITHPSGLASRSPFPITATTPAGSVVFKKSGAATGDTEGSLLVVKATLDVDVKFRGNVEMTDQIVAQPFADHGDSGSLAVEKTSGQPVGLVVAVSEPDEAGQQLTVLSPIDAVLRNLDTGFSLVLPGETL
jgi:hypothetical protein